MSAERYEIFDDGPCIRIVSPDSTISTIIGRPVGYHIDDAVIGAIRQQARDIAELEVLAEIGRQWNTDSSLAKWFPLTADRLWQDAQEIAKLRTDLAAAVAERDRLLKLRDTCEYCDGTGDVHTPTGEWRGECDCVYAQNNKLRTRLAAIEGAPTVAVVCSSHSFGSFVQQRFFGSQLPAIGTELIARPEKD